MLSSTISCCNRNLFGGVCDLLTEGDSITTAVSSDGEELLLSQHVSAILNIDLV